MQFVDAHYMSIIFINLNESYVYSVGRGHFVIMTTWSCQLGIYISIGIVEAERSVTVQIMKNGRSLMLASRFFTAENRDI